MAWSSELALHAPSPFLPVGWGVPSVWIINWSALTGQRWSRLVDEQGGIPCCVVWIINCPVKLPSVCRRSVPRVPLVLHTQPPGPAPRALTLLLPGPRRGLVVGEHPPGAKHLGSLGPPHPGSQDALPQGVPPPCCGWCAAPVCSCPGRVSQNQRLLRTSVGHSSDGSIAAVS